MDYSRSIMEILESKLSPTSTLDVGSKAGHESESGLNGDVDAAISEAGVSYAVGMPFSRREAYRRVMNVNKYK